MVISQCNNGANVTWPKLASEHITSNMDIFIISGYNMNDTKTAHIHFHGIGTWK